MDSVEKEEIYGNGVECVLLEKIHSHDEGTIEKVLAKGPVEHCEEEAENYNGLNDLTIMRLDEFCDIADHIH